MARFSDASKANAHQFSDRATALIIPEKNILEAFLPTGIVRRLDQESENVREGMRITFKLLAEMNEISRQNNAQFVVASYRQRRWSSRSTWSTIRNYLSAML